MSRRTFWTWCGGGVRPILILGLIGLLIWGATISSAYQMRLFTIVGIYALLALGYQFIFGHAGALALTQGSFFGVGAYATGILGTRYGLSADYTLVLSVQRERAPDTNCPVRPLAFRPLRLAKPSSLRSESSS